MVLRSAPGGRLRLRLRLRKRGCCGHAVLRLSLGVKGRWVKGERESQMGVIAWSSPGIGTKFKQLII